MNNGAVIKERRMNSKKTSNHMKKRYIWAYIFLLPQAIVFLGLSLYPIVMSYVYSFYDWTGIGPMDNFIGLGNYTELLSEPMFWSAFWNTIIYVVGTTVIGVSLSLVFAIILNDTRFKGKSIYRTVYFLPVVTTTAIIGIIMANIFGNQGFVNQLLKYINIIDQSIPWLTSPILAMVVLVVVGSWKGLGITMIYWLAGLQSISKDLYESASLDGAGFWRTLRYITLPLLKPVFAVIVLLSIVNGMNVFDLVKTLTDGGPYFATETLDLFIYRHAFSGAAGGIPRMGYASAAGVLLGIFTFLISLIFGLLGFGPGLRKQNNIQKGGRRHDNQ